MITDFVMIVSGIVIMVIVNNICLECNMHQLWKGSVERNLSIIDKVGACLTMFGFVSLVFL